MARSDTVMAFGALCFGLSVVFITYRTLVRTTDKADVTDIAAVIAAVGGGAVTSLFDPKATNLFGWYSIGLAAGIAIFFVLYLVMNGRSDAAKVMSGRTITGRRNEDLGPQRYMVHPDLWLVTAKRAYVAHLLVGGTRPHLGVSPETG